MARRGDKLREHILWVAKGVFLEMGFERASMDVVANRAETSKRSVYAHFESKEKLFLAVIELMRGLFLSNLKSPADYSDKPAEALVLFCARYLEILLFEGSIQMCRIGMAETARFPEGAAQYYDVMFAQVHERLGSYLKTAFGLSAKASYLAAQKLLGRILYPQFHRALFGIDKLAKTVSDHGSPGVDRKPLRRAVADFIESIA
ncbi:MAG TPA: TetR/AcrR family transcriptional regulator [Acidobacteriaceae bacterium]|nr:TetR/AcrR family transcriptional regulator [Acidobacteriaceae bacterium]